MLPAQHVLRLVVVFLQAEGGSKSGDQLKRGNGGKGNRTDARGPDSARDRPSWNGSAKVVLLVGSDLRQNEAGIGNAGDINHRGRDDTEVIDAGHCQPTELP